MALERIATKFPARPHALEAVEVDAGIELGALDDGSVNRSRIPAVFNSARVLPRVFRSSGTPERRRQLGALRGLSVGENGAAPGHCEVVTFGATPM